MRDLRNDIAGYLRNEGFAVRIYPNALFVYLTARTVTVNDVAPALGDVVDLVRLSAAGDPQHYSRQGVLILF